jgi:hypothetical protein
MRIFVVSFLLSALVFLIGESRVFASVTVVDEQNGSLILDVRLDERGGGIRMIDEPGLPRVRYEGFFVAVPGGAGVRVRHVDPLFEDRAGELPPINPVNEGERAARSMPSGFFPAQPFVVSGPFTFRRSTVVAVHCYASQVDYASGTHRVWSGYRIHIDYPPAARSVFAERADPLVSALVVNKRTIPQPAPSRSVSGRASAASDPHFSLSQNWVKIWIQRPGVYSIEGSDLASIGIDLASITDPNSFRLFTGGGQQLSRDLAAPNQTYLPGNWMAECDLLVEYGGDGSFDVGDRIVFYAVATPGWRDRYEPGSPRDDYTDHQHVDHNIYFLSWDDTGFSGQPKRMATIDATPSAAPDVTTFEDRQYFEIDRVQDFAFGGDGWLWFEVAAQQGAQSFPFPPFFVSDLDTSVPQTFRTVAVSKLKVNNANHHARYRMNGTVIADKVWNGGPKYRFEDAQPVEATGFFLNEGNNGLVLDVPRDLNPSDFMYFAWYSVFYQRHLRALGDRLSFSSPDTTGTIDLNVDRFSTAGSMYLFDVTDPLRPQRLVDFVESSAGGVRGVEFSTSVAGGHRYYWAGTEVAVRGSKATLARHTPRDLRNVAAAPNMVIVTHPAFLSAAQRLQQHRESSLPLFSDPVVDVVTTTAVFDNFSGGLADPMAIRNYCKFLYDNYTDSGGSPLLTYLLLLGDANADFKGNASTLPNFVTTNLNLEGGAIEDYVTDDYYAYLDSTDTLGAGYLDLGIGRLPARSLQEASFLVDRVIDYELDADFGVWRDRIILAADDENSTFTTVQSDFIVVSEDLANGFLASYLDPHKIYLTEYPEIQGVKPGSRIQFISDWNEGALVIHYTGHGSSTKIADELLFIDADVASLRNGLRLPLFMGMSCTIGNFADPGQSLSERLLFKDGGGVVATVTASELTFIVPNNYVSINLLSGMFPPQPGLAQPLGIALMNAKNATLLIGLIVHGERDYQENNEKYNLLGDPALRLRSPRQAIQFDSTGVDTVVSGRRETVRGKVFSNGQPDTGFSGTVRLVVREPDDASGYTRESDGFHIDYRYPGGTIYTGTADVVAGDFEFSFKIPRFSQTGDKAFVLAYADNGSVDAAAKVDDLVFRAPLPTDTTALQPVDGAPRIELGFQGRQQIVKPGAILLGRVEDADGINILNTTPEGKLALVIDKADLALDVTSSFEYDHGGADTSGTLKYPLPDLDVGQHTAVLKVSDTFGQTSLDTLVFELTDPLNYSAQVVLNYPNPFVSSTYFLVNLTDRADIHLDIFTVSGKRIRSLAATRDAGEQWILWDGRDSAGGTIANGTYLYVAKIGFVGLDRPALVLRGKMVKIE